MSTEKLSGEFNFRSRQTRIAAILHGAQTELLIFLKMARHNQLIINVDQYYFSVLLNVTNYRPVLFS